MNKEQLVEKAFEKWWREFVKKDLGLNVKAIPDHKIEKSFKAAFDLLMPIIEKHQKCIEFYANKKNWMDLELLGYPSAILKDEEYIGKLYIGGKTARQTLSEIEAALKGMEK